MRCDALRKCVIYSATLRRNDSLTLSLSLWCNVVVVDPQLHRLRIRSSHTTIRDGNSRIPGAHWCPPVSVPSCYLQRVPNYVQRSAHCGTGGCKSGSGRSVDGAEGLEMVYVARASSEFAQSSRRDSGRPGAEPAPEGGIPDPGDGPEVESVSFFKSELLNYYFRLFCFPKQNLIVCGLTPLSLFTHSLRDILKVHYLVALMDIL